MLASVCSPEPLQIQQRLGERILRRPLQQPAARCSRSARCRREAARPAWSWRRRHNARARDRRVAAGGSTCSRPQFRAFALLDRAENALGVRSLAAPVLGAGRGGRLSRSSCRARRHGSTTRRLNALAGELKAAAKLCSRASPLLGDRRAPHPSAVHPEPPSVRSAVPTGTVASGLRLRVPQRAPRPLPALRDALHREES